MHQLSPSLAMSNFKNNKDYSNIIILYFVNACIHIVTNLYTFIWDYIDMS